MAYIPAMEIVRTHTFLKALKKLGASDADLEKLELEIATNPFLMAYRFAT